MSNRVFGLITMAVFLWSSSPLVAQDAKAPAEELFIETSAATGLDFVHFNGMSGELYFSETPGGGGALFDYDGDGDLDVFIVQGNMVDGKPIEKALFPPRQSGPLCARLLRNDLVVDGASRRLRFTDVTAASKLAACEYGMGATTGDIDNDGDVDLFITNFGPNQLWRNNGDGTFSDITAASGVIDHEWSVSAAFFDFDRDGWLDLYVGNYLDFRIATHRPCFGASGVRDYCGPNAYRPELDRLFHNRGPGADGQVSFADVSKKAGLEAAYGGALGVATGDFDGDGWLDVYVANDQLPNQQWMNRHDGTFENLALLGGSAVNAEGVPEASMGVDSGDIDGDGDEDLFMAHLTGETNTLYSNEGQGFFSDTTAASQLDLPSFTFTGFGAKFIDYDNDGLLDILVANGAVKTIEALAKSGDPYPLHQTNQLFHNLGQGRFAEVSAHAGAAFALSEVSRGVAMGDLDNDGDSDVVIFNNNGPTRLLDNQVGNQSSWIGLVVRDEALQRDAYGARVGVFVPGRAPLWRRVRSDGSYASGNDPRLLFGLGKATQIDKVRVEWLGGDVEEWRDLPLGAYSVLRRGEGQRVAVPAAAASSESGKEGDENR